MSLVPNLDACDVDELRRFASHHIGGKNHRTLFPDGDKITADKLAHYAMNKAEAMSCRLDGNIQSALMYEDICDGIYKELPAMARW